MLNEDGRLLSISGGLPFDARQTAKDDAPLLILTPELMEALVRAYYCCREVGSWEQNDYEVRANRAADLIAEALRPLGVSV